MEKHKNIKAVCARSNTEWRKWLEKNHAKQKSVWLIIFRKESKVKSVYYNEAVEEAICFGWIDSVANSRDEQSYYLYFAPRKPRSKWSKANRDRVEKLTKQGRMTAAGQTLIDLAKRTGTWEALMDVENSVIPDDLKTQFDKNKKAFENFQAFPPSSKRIILEWIQNAKKPETREKRIKETVELAQKNMRANHYRQ